MRIAAIIVNYRTPALALRAVASVDREQQTLPGLRLVLVDGGSGDDSPERLAKGLEALGRPDWIDLVCLPVNGGFGYANNQALLRLTAAPMPPDYICLLNPDAAIVPGALSRMAALLDREPRAGAVGARLQGADGTPQGSAFTFPSAGGEFVRGANTDVIRRVLGTPPVAVAPEKAARVPWVTGAAVMLRREALAETGLFDDGFFLYFEEVELMRRMTRVGWEVWHEPAAQVEHVGGSATDVRWDEQGFHKPAPLPAYWYRSRRRYHARTAGQAAAMMAALLFVAGRLLWLVRSRLERRPDRFPHRMARDTLRHALLPDRRDRLPRRLPQLGDAPGARPAWMEA